jgi:alkylated DNA repair dioxygenase AlkB
VRQLARRILRSWVISKKGLDTGLKGTSTSHNVIFNQNMNHKELFGSDDDSAEEDSVQNSPYSHQNVKGLVIYKNIVPKDTQKTLACFAVSEMSGKKLNSHWIDNKFDQSLQEHMEMDQLMYFGKLPDATQCIVPMLQSILFKHVPVTGDLNQLIVNYYKPGKGIKPHVDLLRFQDGIVGVSLLSSAVMTFKPHRPSFISAYASACADSSADSSADASAYARANQNPNECRCNTKDCPMLVKNTLQSDSSQFKILLEPGDVYILSEDARWHWTHEIAYMLGETHPDARSSRGTIERQDRISYTFRRLFRD